MDEAPLLLVEPDASFCQGIERAAEGYGIEVVVAENAKAALEIASAVEPRCAVIELTLPDKDGLWLTSELRAAAVLAAMPIVLLTANDDVLLRLRALQSGIDILLAKPIEPAVLLAQVRALTAMAGRIRDRGAVSSMLRRAALDGSPSSAGPAAPFGGDIAAMPPATALTILELDRRSGEFALRAVGRPDLVLDIASGFVTQGRLGDRVLEPIDAVREAVGVKRGRFEFRAGLSRPAPPGLVPTTRHLWAALEEAARSTEHGGAHSSAPPTEIAPPPTEALARPAAPRPQRRTTLASSPAIEPTSPRRGVNVVVQPSKPGSKGGHDDG